MDKKRKIEKPFKQGHLGQPEVLPQVDPKEPFNPDEQPDIDPDENPLIAPPEEFPFPGESLAKY
ncbi:MAG: hypothetical protein ABJB16_01710 [Saprospiraceae bacterium]